MASMDLLEINCVWYSLSLPHSLCTTCFSSLTSSFYFLSMKFVCWLGRSGWPFPGPWWPVWSLSKESLEPWGPIVLMALALRDAKKEAAAWLGD